MRVIRPRIGGAGGTQARAKTPHWQLRGKTGKGKQLWEHHEQREHREQRENSRYEDVEQRKAILTYILSS
jgi:hypothetical protein